MNERWLPVVGYEGLYEVSDLGRVHSLGRLSAHSSGTGVQRRPAKILKQNKAGAGYSFVNLWKDGKAKAHYVHRLVATAFLPPSDAPHVNHKDFDKDNNRAGNLEWTTPAKNTAHAVKGGRHYLPSPMRLAMNNPAVATKLSKNDVLAIRAACAAGEKHKAIGARYGIAVVTVGRIKRGASWSSGPASGVTPG